MQQAAAYLDPFALHTADGAARSQSKPSWQTATQIQANNLLVGRPAPPASLCQYCGTTLEYQAMAGGIFGSVIPITAWFPTRCHCSSAIECHAREESEAEARRQEAAEQARLARGRACVARLTQESGMARKFLERRLDTFVVTHENESAYRVAQWYVAQWKTNFSLGRGLYLIGGVGAGKTHLAAGIANALLEQRIPVVCKTAGAILQDIRRTFNHDALITEADVTEAYRTVDLLVIDDLGKEPATDWAIATLYSVINDRYERMLPIVATTNYPDDALVRRLAFRGDMTTGEAIVSRLHEMCVGVEMWFADYRLGGRK